MPISSAGTLADPLVSVSLDCRHGFDAAVL
jgi:hypothetical protein